MDAITLPVKRLDDSLEMPAYAHFGDAGLDLRSAEDAKLEPFVDTHHEAVLRLIEMSAKNAHANNAWIGICGELAADLSLTEEFLKMGIDELSVSPPFVLPLREKVRSISLK